MPIHDAPVKFNEPINLSLPLNRQLYNGHATLRRHAPDMREVSADGVLWHRVRLCCGESIPATCKTWEEVVPDVPMGVQGTNAG